MDDTQLFPSLLKENTPLSLDEEYILYDVKSLFINIPTDKTTSYMINKIYMNKLPQVCSKIILKRLLCKSTTEVLLQFNYNLLKQTNGFKMAGPLSIILADIHTVIPTHPHQVGVTCIQKSTPACQKICLFTLIFTLQAGNRKI